MSRTGRAKGFGEDGTPARFGIERTVIGTLTAWKLEDAKARFSEVVRRAREQGPQRVTYHGKDAVVVIAVDDLKRLLPAGRPRQSVVDFLQETALGEIDVRRAPDRGRDVAV
jgi:prevent-host-death family protein